MLEYNEITPRRYIIVDKEPYEVIEAHVFRKQQRKPVNATKLRNLITGNIKEISFHVSDKVEEAELETKQVKFLYTNRGEYWFVEKDDASKRFQIGTALLGDPINFMKANSLVDALIFKEKIIGIKYPIKVELKVVEAPPAVKGDTAKGGSKQIKLETGATINAPLFINEGDIIRVNTETGEYAERAS
ncbi:MAG: elongation factor P [bacterium]|nr:elongation factor P [bacterium]